MKGKRLLSKEEIEYIKKLLDKKPRASPRRKKVIRVKLSVYTIIEFLIEVWGWVKIMASPFLAAVFVGSFIYFPSPNTTKLVIASSLVFAGLIGGVILANRAWKRNGTMDYLSEIMELHDFDNLKADKDSADTGDTK